MFLEFIIGLYFGIGFFIAYKSVLLAYDNNVSGFKDKYLQLSEFEKAFDLIIIMIIQFVGQKVLLLNKFKNAAEHGFLSLR